MNKKKGKKKKECKLVNLTNSYLSFLQFKIKKLIHELSNNEQTK